MLIPEIPDQAELAAQIEAMNAEASALEPAAKSSGVSVPERPQAGLCDVETFVNLRAHVSELKSLLGVSNPPKQTSLAAGATGKADKPNWTARALASQRCNPKQAPFAAGAPTKAAATNWTERAALAKRGNQAATPKAQSNAERLKALEAEYAQLEAKRRAENKSTIEKWRIEELEGKNARMKADLKKWHATPENN